MSVLVFGDGYDFKAARGIIKANCMCNQCTAFN